MGPPLPTSFLAIFLHHHQRLIFRLISSDAPPFPQNKWWWPIGSFFTHVGWDFLPRGFITHPHSQPLDPPFDPHGKGFWIPLPQSFFLASISAVIIGWHKKFCLPWYIFVMIMVLIDSHATIIIIMITSHFCGEQKKTQPGQSQWRGKAKLRARPPPSSSCSPYCFHERGGFSSSSNLFMSLHFKRAWGRSFFLLLFHILCKDRWINMGVWGGWKNALEKLLI